MVTKSAPSRKAFDLSEFKAMDEQAGTFEGYLSVFGNTDQGGDVVTHGAFTKTISEAKSRKEAQGGPFLYPILWQHNPNEPIGGFTEVVEVEGKGLHVKGQLDLDIPQGQRAYSGLKKGYIKGLSIGFDTVKDVWQSGKRMLKEVKLWEGSVVTFAMNDKAFATSVKAIGETESCLDFGECIVAAKQDQIMWERWYDIQDALRRSCWNTIDSDIDTDLKMAQLSSNVDQYKLALMSWATTALSHQNIGTEAYDEMKSTFAEMESESTTFDVKSGRVLSTRNRQLLSAMADTLEEQLKNARDLLAATEPSTSKDDDPEESKDTPEGQKGEEPGEGETPTLEIDPSWISGLLDDIRRDTATTVAA